jgi:capping protein alpha
MATQEEIQGIIRDFVLASPAGELMEVVTDVRTLLKNDELLNSVAPSAFKAYNTEQMIVVDTPKGKALVTKYNEVNGSDYLDPANGQVVSYDHIKQAVSGTRGISGELDSEVESYRQAFEKAAHAYATESYPSGVSGVYGSKEGGNHVVTICISAGLFNPKNYWGGRWRSVWTVKFKPGSGNAQLDGNFKIQIHYYEEGNVQLNTNTDRSKSVPVSDAASFADKALKIIAAAESDFHAALDKSYATMGQTTFKALRRPLPITRQKITWEKIMQYKVGDSLGK